MKCDVAVIGAGAAGMMAAGIAAGRGLDTVMIERCDRPGRKLMITGKGRCNLTNDCQTDEFMTNVPTGGRFLFGALSRFSPRDCMAFFEGLGVPVKVERGRRVFPQSDKAADVVDALRRFSNGARAVHGRVKAVLAENGAVNGVELENGNVIEAKAVIICTGGRSYPATGSTGDGYDFAQSMGHTIIPARPSLVPLETAEQWPRDAQGLSLRNVTLEVCLKGKTVFSELGELLFTHFGVSGPLVLSASSHMRDYRAVIDGEYSLLIDLKPALSPEQLDQRLQRDFLKYSNRDFINALGDLLPSKLIPVAVSLSGIHAQTKVNQITHEQRMAFVRLLKGLKLTVRDFRPIEEAVVTSGGVSLKEVNPTTMESKLVHGLYFAGEVLDIDAYTGGFNLQIAFSTGRAAGMSVLKTSEG